MFCWHWCRHPLLFCLRFLISIEGNLSELNLDLSKDKSPSRKCKPRSSWMYCSLHLRQVIKHCSVQIIDGFVYQHHLVLPQIILFCLCVIREHLFKECLHDSLTQWAVKTEQKPWWMACCWNAETKDQLLSWYSYYIFEINIDGWTTHGW